MRPVFRRAQMAAFAFLFLPAIAGAVIERLSTADLQRALDLARGSDAERARFEAQYVFRFDDPTVERLEIITPFRRAELYGEDRLRIGDHLFGPMDAARALRSSEGEVTIRARLRFNPMNVYVTVPDFAIVVGDPAPGGLRVEPIRESRTPEFGAGGEGTKQKTQPILGATVEAVYEAGALEQQTWAVGVWLGQQKYAAVPVRFGSLQ
jgi:hypothetical protein